MEIGAKSTYNYIITFHIGDFFQCRKKKDLKNNLPN